MAVLPKNPKPNIDSSASTGGVVRVKQEVVARTIQIIREAREIREKREGANLNVIRRQT